MSTSSATFLGVKANFSLPLVLRTPAPATPPSNIQFIRTLGHGSYGEVAQCKDLEEGGLVAVKRVINVFDSEVRFRFVTR